VFPVFCVAAITACHLDLGQVDSAFYNWDDRKIHCAVDIDSSADNSMSSIESGLDRARDTGEVLEIYAHEPGSTVAWSTIESVLAGAQSRGLAFVTFDDILAGNRPTTGGIAMSFDDAHVPQWFSGRPMFQQYSARLTFWIAYYDTYTKDDKSNLVQLAGDGHAVEAHTVRHQRAPEYVEQYGVDAWMSDEVQPSIDQLRADGYTVDAFAYPYGSRTDETDKAVLDQVKIVRSVAYAWDSPAMDPCPY
jgi:peptidoglycan/xylan/chitin deacetylase (PgdA/CDA1 family)